jgi:predicted nucleic acid-binding protein
MIVEALPNPIAVVSVIPEELEDGRHRVRQDATLLYELIEAKLVRIVDMDDGASVHFEQLVVGPAEETLDDGEAATIAYAVSQNGIAVIDERKASRICAQRFPRLGLTSTIDLFRHPAVHSALGTEKLADAVFNALSQGRMRVFHFHVEWVIELIGRERANLCTSLPRSVRVAHKAVSKKAAATKGGANE